MSAPLVKALACVTLSCSEPARLIDLMRTVLGWDVAVEGVLDAGLDGLWGIAPGSAGAKFTVLRAPGTKFGMIRVVSGAERRPTRQIGARWSGLEIVVMSDVDGLHAALDAHPDFNVIAPPHSFDFTQAGSNIHRSFLGRIPGGTHIVFTLAVTVPKLKGRIFPSSAVRVGQVFATHLVAADYARSFAFYRETLGMVPFLDVHLEKGDWHKTWSLPDGAPVDLSILRGGEPTSRQGSVEMQGYEDRYIDPAVMVPDRLDGGTCLTTYTAAVDLDAAFAAVAGSGDATILSRPQVVPGAPYAMTAVSSFSGLAANGSKSASASRPNAAAGRPRCADHGTG